MLCYYSLGNLVSAQNQNATMLGAMAYIIINKKPARTGKSADDLFIMEAGAIPTVTHYEKSYSGFKIYPLYNYTKELAEKHLLYINKKELTTDYLKNNAAKILSGNEIKQNPFE